MFSSKYNKIPLLFLFCTAVTVAAIFCYCELYEENNLLKQQLLNTHEETTQLKEELSKTQEEAKILKERLTTINRFAQIYNTSPEVISLVFRESEKNGVHPGIMLELIKTESNFDPKAVSKDGAKGLCQIQPTTARELCRELGISFTPQKLFNSDFNITLGAYYLKKLLKSNNGDYHRALTAYNRGPAGLEAYIRNRGTAVSRYSQRISSRGMQYHNPNQ